MFVTRINHEIFAGKLTLFDNIRCISVAVKSLNITSTYLIFSVMKIAFFLCVNLD